MEGHRPNYGVLLKCDKGKFKFRAREEMMKNPARLVIDYSLVK